MNNQQIIDYISGVAGAENVITQKEELICYTYNAGAAAPSEFLPILVVLPDNKEQISKVVAYCNENKISVVTRSANSCLSVNAITESERSIIVSMQKFKHIEIDPETLTAVVGPGYITGDIKKEAAKHGLFYPPDPASFLYSTIGGNVATDAGGLQCVKYGTTKSYVAGLEIVLASGDIIRTGGKCIKDVTGYNLTQLFVGSEGTLGIITEIILKLVPLPEGKKSILVAFDDVENAAKAVSQIMVSGVVPAIMEFSENTCIRAIEEYAHAGLPVEAAAMLLIEIDGAVSTLEPQAATIKEVCSKLGMVEFRVSQNEKEAENIWLARRASLPAMARVAKGRLGGDPAVPINRLADVVHMLHALGKKYELKVACQGHAGDGNVHPHFFFNNDEEKARASKARDEFHDGILKLGGTVSAEHGVGREKIKYMKKQFGEVQVQKMIGIKKVFDPNNIFNPGCMFGDMV